MEGTLSILMNLSSTSEEVTTWNTTIPKVNLSIHEAASQATEAQDTWAVAAEDIAVPIGVIEALIVDTDNQAVAEVVMTTMLETISTTTL